MEFTTRPKHTLRDEDEVHLIFRVFPFRFFFNYSLDENLSVPEHESWLSLLFPRFNEDDYDYCRMVTVRRTFTVIASSVLFFSFSVISIDGNLNR